MSTPEQIEMQNKWFAMLRSGEYKQTKNILRSSKTGGYCCLGVAALLVAGQKEADSYFDSQGNLSYQRDTMKALGFRDADGGFAKPIEFGGRTISSFVDANDNCGLTFAEIAGLAEKNRDICFV